MKERWKKGEGKELHHEELYSYNFQVMLLGESKNDGVSGRKHVTGKKRKGRQFYSNLVARCRLRNAGQLTDCSLQCGESRLAAQQKNKKHGERKLQCLRSSQSHKLRRGTHTGVRRASSTRRKRAGTVLVPTDYGLHTDVNTTRRIRYVYIYHPKISVFDEKSLNRALRHVQ